MSDLRFKVGDRVKIVRSHVSKIRGNDVKVLADTWIGKTGTVAVVLQPSAHKNVQTPYDYSLAIDSPGPRNSESSICAYDDELEAL